ncbi:unnamed protein product [Dracunculus medinensis]|uniref:ATP-dependent helicase C-terminal domain-containing protein n=1 Tax=Dracunculus medinensis TaxID=318479 RepID=A0A3P7PT13_DRAME|nr:unnamed protein product [Dracunculus medinensis]
MRGAIREAKTVLEMILKDDEEIRTIMDNTDAPFGQLNQEKREIFVEKNDVAMLLSQLQTLENVLDNFKNNITGRSVAKLDGQVYPGTKMIQLLEEAKIRKDFRDRIARLTDKIGQYLTHKTEQEDEAVKGVYLQLFSSFVSTVYADSYDPLKPLFEIKTPQAENAYLHRTAVTFAEKYQVLLQCENMYSLNVRSVIVTSGTLSPLDVFTNNLGITFKIKLENNHIANTSQIIGACIRADKQGTPLCGFKTKTLLYLIKEKKSNGQSVWSEMGRLKKLFEEPKSKSELKIILARYKESIKYDGGAVLFAVCRGKVSEGIDFADNESRGVVVVGIPFAPVNDARVELKKQFLAQSNAGKLSKNVSFLSFKLLLSLFLISLGFCFKLLSSSLLFLFFIAAKK